MHNQANNTLLALLVKGIVGMNVGNIRGWRMVRLGAPGCVASGLRTRRLSLFVRCGPRQRRTHLRRGSDATFPLP